jgi:hypothetical protein
MTFSRKLKENQLKEEEKEVFKNTRRGCLKSRLSGAYATASLFRQPLRINIVFLVQAQKKLAC